MNIFYLVVVQCPNRVLQATPASILVKGTCIHFKFADIQKKYREGKKQAKIPFKIIIHTKFSLLCVVSCTRMDIAKNKLR